jgi:centromere/kinetochore protein ZW10
MLSLADSFAAIAKIPLEKTIRAVRLLDKKATDLRAHLKEHLFNVWDALVHIRQENGAISITISEKLPNEATSLSDTVIAFQSFKELDIVAKKLWDNLDATIFQRRTDIDVGSLPRFQVNEVSLLSYNNEIVH